jgi:hypothetical protein
MWGYSIGFTRDVNRDSSSSVISQQLQKLPVFSFAFEKNDPT